MDIYSYSEQHSDMITLTFLAQQSREEMHLVASIRLDVYVRSNRQTINPGAPNVPLLG